ncbi:MAG: hypothetical protein KDA54_01585, partial [Phycisphaerales bacterium]|nr:hypothetical protein [Phycisphaerales bacterium]
VYVKITRTNMSNSTRWNTNATLTTSTGDMVNLEQDAEFLHIVVANNGDGSKETAMVTLDAVEAEWLESQLRHLRKYMYDQPDE